jgi:hypothetical protein
MSLGQGAGVAGGGDCAAEKVRRQGGSLRRQLCRLGLWLVDRCCAPAAPFSSARRSTPQPSERGRRRMLQGIAKRLAEHRAK